MAKLGLTKKNLRDEIMTLSVENYCEGPNPDRDRPGYIWVFGKQVGAEEIYIKLNITLVSTKVILTHLPRYPFVDFFSEAFLNLCIRQQSLFRHLLQIHRSVWE